MITIIIFSILFGDSSATKSTHFFKSHGIILGISMFSSGSWTLGIWLDINIEDYSIGRHSLFDLIYLLRANVAE